MKNITYNNQELPQLIETIQKLRGEDGCPWDQRQTATSLLSFLKSECDELVDAIQKEDIANICEELGDLLYILLMITEIHSEKSLFNLTEVIKTVNKKLIRRHPHVFEGKPYESEEQLAAQWQAIKAEEKQKNKI